MTKAAATAQQDQDLQEALVESLTDLYTNLQKEIDAFKAEAEEIDQKVNKEVQALEKEAEDFEQEVITATKD